MTNGMSEGYELRAEYLLDTPITNTWRCWTESTLLEQWFHPKSWTTEGKSLDQRPGGTSHIVMHGPNGEVSDGVGVFLEVTAAAAGVHKRIHLGLDSFRAAFGSPLPDHDH